MKCALCRSKRCDVDAIMSDGVTKGFRGTSGRGRRGAAGNGRGQTGISD